MEHEIVERTEGEETEKRVVVDNLHPPLVRKMKIGSNWTKLRVMIRVSTSRAATGSSFPPLYFGVCSSTNPEQPYNDHFFGYRFTYSYNSTDSILITTNSLTSARANISHIANGLVDTPSTTIYRSYVRRIGAGQPGSVLGFEVTKGNPWTFVARGFDDWRNGHSVTQFKQAIDGAAMPPITGTISTITPDEETYGYFDSICFANMSATDVFEVSDIAYARLA